MIRCTYFLAVSVFASVIAATRIAAAQTAPQPAPQPSATPAAQFELGSSLAGGPGSTAASRTYLYGSYARAPRQVLYGEIDQWRQFSQSDLQYTAGAYAPVGAKGILNVDFAVSSTHRVAPASDVSVSYEYRLPKGWGVTGQYENRSYTQLYAQVDALKIDRYAGNGYLSYRISSTTLSGVPGLALTHTLRGMRYYGTDSQSTIGATISVGRDVESIAPNRVLVSPVRSILVDGRHWINDRCAFVWGVQSESVGRLYTRTGGSLGIRRRL